MQDTKALRKYLLIGSLALAFVLGILLTRWFYQKSDSNVSETSTVLLERIKQVAKLVTVEGYFSEIYDYKDYYGYDLGFFRKKALIRVKAKVSVGYDLEKLKITARPGDKTIVVSEVPKAEILSIDHDLDYYDVQEGVFNRFSTEDYNRLNDNVKNYIRQKALDSALMSQAEKQRNLIFDSIRFIVESTGWKLEIEGIGVPQLPDKMFD